MSDEKNKFPSSFVSSQFVKYIDAKEIKGIVEALGNTLAAAQLRDAVLTPKAVQHDTDLLLGRILLAGCSPNVLHNPLGRRLLAHGISVSSPLLDGYDEPEILLSSTR